MSIFYKVSDSELVKFRNEVFKERGIPALNRAGFVKSPFSTAWFGRDNTGGFSYEFCRLGEDSRLDMVWVYIVRGDRWVQEHLNIFRLHPTVTNIDDLKGVDGLAYLLPPNSLLQERVASPTRRKFFNLARHKVGMFISKEGLRRRLERLGNFLEEDLSKIDLHIEKWKSEHDPISVDWNGRPLP